MLIKTRLDSLEKRIKDFPCRAHHGVFPHELKAKKYDNGGPWVECTCGSPILVLDLFEEWEKNRANNAFPLRKL